MIKRLLIVVGCLLFTSNLIAQEEFDFRKANWGMTKEEVKTGENEKFIGEDKEGSNEIVMYKTTLGSLDTIIQYLFTENKLTSATYMIIEEHMNKNFYIEDYKALKAKLTTKYGNPSKDEAIWNKDLFKKNKQNWGIAVSVGDLKYHALWESDNTDIEMLLHGDNYEITLLVLYESKKLKNLYYKASNKKILDDL